jgi:hypothetical protein
MANRYIRPDIIVVFPISAKTPISVPTSEEPAYDLALYSYDIGIKTSDIGSDIVLFDTISKFPAETSDIGYDIEVFTTISDPTVTSEFFSINIGTDIIIITVCSLKCSSKRLTQ